MHCLAVDKSYVRIDFLSTQSGKTENFKSLKYKKVARLEPLYLGRGTKINKKRFAISFGNARLPRLRYSVQLFISFFSFFFLVFFLFTSASV